ncbi:MAG: DUF2934 domain-containing protein [Bacteroidales bacterium]|nr:DUF2934 domain-containing protein [Bacteroidales bacterium]
MSKTTKKYVGTKTGQPHKEVTKASVRKRAYEIYLKRDPDQGSPDNDWLQAEEELMPNPEY